MEFIFAASAWASGLALGIVITNYYAARRWNRLFALMQEWKVSAAYWNRIAAWACERLRIAHIALDERDDEGEEWKRGGKGAR